MLHSKIVHCDIFAEGSSINERQSDCPSDCSIDNEMKLLKKVWFFLRSSINEKFLDTVQKGIPNNQIHKEDLFKYPKGEI